MKFIRLIVIFLLVICNFLFVNQSVSATELVLVANKSLAEIKTIYYYDVRNIFLGRKTSISGHKLRPVVFSKGKFKNEFNSDILEMTDIKLMSYWIKETLSGGSSAPKSLRSVKSIIHYLKKTKGAISYLNSDDAQNSGLVIISIKR